MARWTCKKGGGHEERFRGMKSSCIEGGAQVKHSEKALDAIARKGNEVLS